MLRGNRIYIFVLSIVILLIVTTCYLWSTHEDVWKATYATQDEKPFGTALVYEILPQLFSKQKIARIDLPIYNFLKNKNLRHSNYIFIGNNFNVQKTDMSALLEYAANGNNVFIASNSFNAEFEDTLGFYTTFSVKNNADIFKLENTQETYENKLVNLHFRNSKNFVFKGFNDGYQVIPTDSTAYEVLAIDNVGNPVFIRTKYGEGTIYLHSFPLAFTNYYLLYKQHHEYIENCFSYLPDQVTFWDDYYKVAHELNASKLDFIYQNAPLKWAWYLMICSSCIYLLFRIKRQQRAIPILSIYENSSLEFATTIGRLYFNKGDHRDIVKKQATYWLSFIRKKLNIPTTKLDHSFVLRLSEKSGIAENELTEIIDFIAAINSSKITSDNVRQFYLLLNNFYTKTKQA